jgi:hypothetical protein
VLENQRERGPIIELRKINREEKVNEKLKNEYKKEK